MQRVKEATSPGDIAGVRELFAEYVRSVDAPCCFVDFEKELAALPAGYELLLLAPEAGCVGLRRIDPATAEVKRLYVRPAHRGKGLGRELLERAIREAKTRGYRRVVLDTLPTMSEARELYKAFRFQEIPPYLPAPTPGATCFGLSL
jgi:GNAT superfamily N-acetyltransferase